MHFQAKTCFLTTAAQSFEALNQRAVAVVVDPVQSVKGKVRGVMDVSILMGCCL